MSLGVHAAPTAVVARRVLSLIWPAQHPPPPQGPAPGSLPTSRAANIVRLIALNSTDCVSPHTLLT